MEKSTYVLSEKDREFLSGFLLGGELCEANELQEFADQDFSLLWRKTDEKYVYGVIGGEHRRIRLKFESIERTADNGVEYKIAGKSKIDRSITEIGGEMCIIGIFKLKHLHFGVDDEYKSKEVKSQGVVIGKYKISRISGDSRVGQFEGISYSKWYVDSVGGIHYDDIESFADGYFNNAFIGTYRDNLTGREFICNWGDYRVPSANKDFDIGAGEFMVSHKYVNNGWSDDIDEQEDNWWYVY